LPKAGKYDYPFFDIDHCIDKLRQYHEVLKIDEVTRQIVAETLDMKMRGGGFANLISAMDKYGLVTTGRGNITITDLGKKILYGEAHEVERTKKQAVSNIDLFRELYEQYGDSINQEQIRAFLRQKGNVDISKAQKIAEKVDKIYKNVSNYIVTAKKLAPPSETSSQAPSFGRREVTTESGKEPLKVQKGGLYIEIASDNETLENIQSAKNLLTFWENELRNKQKKEPKAA